MASRLLGAVAVHPDRRLVTRARVRRWRALGLRILAWTVNDVGEMRSLMELGVDGLISDDPALARRTLNGN
jgi:glycerophosphoryl diester phosphodiesterase